MLGLQVKVVSKSKESLLKALQEVVKSIEGGDDNAYIPLNDIDETHIDYCISKKPKTWNIKYF